MSAKRTRPIAWGCRFAAKSSRKLRLSSEARVDLRDIRRYTTQQWGTRQRDIYTAKLKHALQSLVDFPTVGPPRDDLYPGCRRLVVERHVIFYRLTDDEIIVGRVLHQSQEPIGAS